jgi:signal transduction histidine kinase
MSEFPAPVVGFLRTLAIDHRSPAFLLAAPDGKLIASGGELAKYGLTDLVPGTPVDEQADFLFGELPMTAGERFIPFVQMDGMPPTDVYLFRGTEGDWIVLLDATQSERQQQAMQQRANERSLDYQRLEKEIKKKEVLLHCIVHDLAGPLMGIRGGFELLSMTEKISEQGRELIDIGLRQSSRQEKLIGEILQAFAAEIEQFEAFSTNPATAPSVFSAAREVITLLVPASEINQLTMRLDPRVDPQADWKVVGERSRLERIFSNLLENALRHSPSNSQITVGLSDEGDEVMVTIDDQGPGVPAEVAGDLFQKFSQGQGGGRGKIGLGLYFCRITVEKWGGTIGQENRAEGGSRFWFRLPRPKSAQEKTN